MRAFLCKFVVMVLLSKIRPQRAVDKIVYHKCNIFRRKNFSRELTPTGTNKKFQYSSASVSIRRGDDAFFCGKGVEKLPASNQS